MKSGWTRLLPLLTAMACSTAGSEAAPAVVQPVVETAPAPPPTPVVVDLHTDTLTQLQRRGLAMDAPEGLEAGTVALQKGGFNAVVYAIWPGKHPEARDVALSLLDIAEREIQRLPDVSLARSPQELREIVGRGETAVILSLEGAHGLQPGGVDQLDVLNARGVRILGPVWSFSNAYMGSSGDRGGGLTEDGEKLLERARGLGMVVDVSHASDTATLQICRTSPVPVIATHSDAFALHAHARNLSDESIRCIGERGGVIGVNLHSTFLGATADVSRIADHMEHIAQVGGTSAVALGSDFDGYITLPAGIHGAGDIPAVWAELASRGHDEKELAAWKGGNFLRVWEAVLAATTPAKP